MHVLDQVAFLRSKGVAAAMLNALTFDAMNDWPGLRTSRDDGYGRFVWHEQSLCFFETADVDDADRLVVAIFDHSVPGSVEPPLCSFTIPWVNFSF